MNEYLRKVPRQARENASYYGTTDEFDTALRFRLRPQLVRRYAWAIPSAEAIRAIVKYSPLVEIGAGTGYWAHLLQRAGAQIIPYDSHPPGVPGVKTRGQYDAIRYRVDAMYNYYGHRKAWTRVLRGGPEMVGRHPWHNLFLCWPPYGSPMAERALARFVGRYVIFIGELGGCTATEKFAEKLQDKFEQIKRIEIPQWWGLHDDLTIWRRIEWLVKV